MASTASAMASMVLPVPIGPARMTSSARPMKSPLASDAARPELKWMRWSRYPRTTADPAGLPAPVGAESTSVSHTNSKAIDVPQSHTRRGPAPKKYQLLAQEEILGLKPRTPRELRPDSKQQLGEKRDHRPLHYNRRMRASSRIRFSGGTATFTVAERLRRACDRLDPSRVFGPRRRLQ